MNHASRFMPAATTRPVHPLGVVLVVPFAGFLLWAFIDQPVAAVAIAITFVLAVLGLNVKWRRHLTSAAAQRPFESICHFARDFECRKTDTWVIRAVYEEVQSHLRPLHAQFPLRASDQLTADLGMDPDDIEFDIATRVAERTGRSLDDSSANPYFSCVVTAGDMVRFFCLQPRAVQPNTSLERTREG